MTFLTMQQELSDRLGAYDIAVPSDLTKLKRWLNMAQQYICGKLNWPFMLAYEIVQTVTDITTGTVSVNSGSSTITFSSAPSVSVANRYIKFSSSDDWYQITAHTAASTSATISPTYGQTDNLSAGTFVVRKLLYATTTPLVSYLDIKKTVNSDVLKSLNPSDNDFYLPLYLDTGDSWAYIMGPLDSSGNLQFSLVNSPSSVFNLLVRGIKNLSDMSADADTSIIPSRWHSAIIDIGAGYGFQSLDDTRSAENFELGEIKLNDMLRTFDMDLGRHRVTHSLDSNLEFGPAYRLPSEYGRVS